METANPTAPKLYSSGQIALASFIAAPLAGCWFFSRNYRLLGDSQGANMCMLWGVLGTIAAFVVAFFLPDNFPNMVLPVAYTIALKMAAEGAHGKAIANHLQAGGKLGSWWKVLGISLLFLLAILAILVGVVLLLPAETP